MSKKTLGAPRRVIIAGIEQAITPLTKNVGVIEAKWKRLGVPGSRYEEIRAAFTLRLPADRSRRQMSRD